MPILLLQPSLLQALRMLASTPALGKLCIEVPWDAISDAFHDGAVVCKWASELSKLAALRASSLQHVAVLAETVRVEVERAEGESVIQMLGRLALGAAEYLEWG
jgi:hypothetical protein